MIPIAFAGFYLATKIWNAKPKAKSQESTPASPTEVAATGTVAATAGLTRSDDDKKSDDQVAQ